MDSKTKLEPNAPRFKIGNVGHPKNRTAFKWWSTREAQGYAELLTLQPSNSVETIAARVAKSPAYVNGRLQLLKLIDEASQAFRAA
jgi:hypothetical protein